MNAVNLIDNSVKPNFSNRSQLTRDQFMSILVNELKNQNPFEPMNNVDFMNQMIGLQSLDAFSKLTDSLDQFQQLTNLSSASSFIGKVVVAKDVRNNDISGIVTSARIEDSRVFVIVDGNQIPLENIVEVKGMFGF